MKHGAIRRIVLGGLAAIVCLLLTGCARQEAGGVQVLVDGQLFSSASVSQNAQTAMRVYITLDGDALVDLPFGEEHTVTIRQADGAENTVRCTRDAVYMESANCENQDCVHMGAVTEENVEMRVMGGFIICLPHKLSVEVRGH